VAIRLMIACSPCRSPVLLPGRRCRSLARLFRVGSSICALYRSTVGWGVFVQPSNTNTFVHRGTFRVAESSRVAMCVFVRDPAQDHRQCLRHSTAQSRAHTDCCCQAAATSICKETRQVSSPHRDQVTHSPHCGTDGRASWKTVGRWCTLLPRASLNNRDEGHPNSKLLKGSQLT
jgi:hypothetical protein